MREYALVLLVAAAVTYLLTPLVRRVAIVTHTMHEPRARDVHAKPTPLLGGLAMYGGLVAGLIVASRLSFLQDSFQAAGARTEAGLLLSGGLVVVIGFVDDRWGLSALSKLAGQVAAAGILVWSGQSLPWLPTPSGGVFSLEPDLSLTLTILLVVVTMNAINFIDGLDGLAAGVVAVAALSFLVYSYTLVKTIGNTYQSLPAVASALLVGMCLGFLPHNFFPARIFMGDIGAMLLGLLLAYGPISSTAELDPTVLTHYAGPTVNRFPTILPILVPAAIFMIPYTDLVVAVLRRAKAGKPLMAADRDHLHHRLLSIGHSYRQSVLIMYLWAALFSVTVVALSLVRTQLIFLAIATVIALLLLLPVTMPRLRPWQARDRLRGAGKAVVQGGGGQVGIGQGNAGSDGVGPDGVGRGGVSRGGAGRGVVQGGELVRSGAATRSPSAGSPVPGSPILGSPIPGQPDSGQPGSGQSGSGASDPGFPGPGSPGPGSSGGSGFPGPGSSGPGSSGPGSSGPGSSGPGSSGSGTSGSGNPGPGNSATGSSASGSGTAADARSAPWPAPPFAGNHGRYGGDSGRLGGSPGSFGENSGPFGGDTGPRGAGHSTHISFDPFAGTTQEPLPGTDQHPLSGASQDPFAGPEQDSFSGSDQDPFAGPGRGTLTGTEPFPQAGFFDPRPR